MNYLEIVYSSKFELTHSKSFQEPFWISANWSQVACDILVTWRIEPQIIVDQNSLLSFQDGIQKIARFLPSKKSYPLKNW